MITPPAATSAGVSGTPKSTATPAASGSTSANPISDCAPAGAATALTGDGSTFVQPLFTDIFQRYAAQCSVQVNYQGVGSGQGIKDLGSETVDFADSDAIMTADQKAAAQGGAVVHIPVTSDAVAIIYNVSGLSSGAITLDGTTLANIFLGNIAKWNDAAIAALNPGVTLPNKDIVVVHRSDGSGTTFIFTNYLTKVSNEWSSAVGNASSVTWPTGIGESGSSGVAGQVQQQDGSIGYVSFAYATKNSINYAKMKNSSGTAVSPTIETARAASTGLTLPDNMEIVITDSPGANAYPISGFTWLLLYTTQTDKNKAEALAHMASWILTTAQQYDEADSFVPLSSDAQGKALAELATVTYQGTPITQLN